MTILHVTDFHFNQRWFDWLLRAAPANDLTVLSGDLLDARASTPLRAQIEWVTTWLNAFPRPLCVCSGRHDLEWEPARQRWMPAYWLRELRNPLVRTDGQRVVLNGVSVLSIGATTRPKGGDADVWVVHTPPAGTLVATRGDGVESGDRDLMAAVLRHQPQLVLSGHVHAPLHWRERRDGTVFVNPGRNPAAAFPNHVLVRTDTQQCQLIAGPRVHGRPLDFAASVVAPLRDEDLPAASGFSQSGTEAAIAPALL